MKFNKGLQIGNLKLTTPIVQGGMGVGISLSGLASAVALSGGVGVISAVGIGMGEKDFGSDYINACNNALHKEIQKAKEIKGSIGAIGVNIMVAARNFEELSKTAMASGADIIFAGAGLPLSLPSFKSAGCNTKLIPIISSPRAVKIIAKKWMEKYNYVPDGFVLEGPKAGGHLGFAKENLDNPEYSLEALIPQVKAEIKKIEKATGVKIPLIAGGGIFTGQDIKAAMELGADGVQMGTRFVATHECDAHINFKNAYVNAKLEDIGIIKSPVGMPGRAIRNIFVEKVENGEKSPVNCPFHCIITCKKEESPYCIATALISSCKGNLDNGFVFAGSNAYKIDKIVSVEELVEELATDFNK